MMDNLTAIVVFACSPFEEGKHKQLSYKRHHDQLLFNRLNKRVTSLAHKTGLPHFTIDEKRQTGKTFGEKLNHTIQEYFDLGFENLIILGNDTPALNVAILNKAVIQIESGRDVFGPDLRGGLYLIGLRKQSYSANAFKSFRWQSNLLFTDFINYYTQAEVYILPKMKDLNSKLDAINSIFDFNLSSSIRKLLSVCLESHHYFIQKHIIFLFNLDLYRCIPLRAPPSFD